MLGLEKGEDITEGDLCVIERNLNMSCALAAESFDEIPDKTLVPIAENIIYAGTQKVTENILKGKKKK